MDLNHSPIIVLGGGGHARVVIDLALAAGREVLGYVDAQPGKVATSIMGAPLLGDDSALRQYRRDEVQLINGVGSVGSSRMRRILYDRSIGEGYSFATLVHPSAVIGRDVAIEAGVVVMAGVVVQTGAQIGVNAILNTRSSIDHECVVGEHSHIAPGVVVSGGVRIGMSAHLGTGAVVIQGISIGDEAFIAAGAVVVADIAARSRVRGIPAKTY